MHRKAQGLVVVFSSLAASLGCAIYLPAPSSSPAPLAPQVDFFAPPPEDVFSAQIALWQASAEWERVSQELRNLRGRAAGAPSTPLAHSYEAISRELRERILEHVARWIQAQSAYRYARDVGGDHWPVLGEVLALGNDDCDGLELLVFALLRDLGFGKGELYRAILRNEANGVHHMVTLWFPPGTPGDPRVVDPTGELGPGVVRLAERPEWRALRLFDEHEQFAARLLPPRGARE